MLEMLSNRNIKNRKKLERLYTHYNIDIDIKGMEFIRLYMVEFYEITTQDNNKRYELRQCYKNVYTPLNHDYTIDFNFLDHNINVSDTVRGVSFYYDSQQALYKDFYARYQYYQITEDNKHLFKSYEQVFNEDLIIKNMIEDIDKQLNNNKYIVNSFTPFIVAYDWDIRHVNKAIEQLKQKHNLIIRKQEDISNNSYTVFFHDLDK
ncbi:hypothetical protein JTZ62_04615 [Mammaliicoccus sciuri]|uniref:hypothetical protein n=1 Tax=Mammaliicoccus sciuri TaxID=1296 RepID=UPI0019D3508E|nr:hypothetical protein [Mammaliicoccus sciuri]QSN68441.1 hypothetical protein JTZ62_04615 [Mammaliicoccus sciuri]UIU23182.1 hypothetical protein LLZ87_04625 [Mammaliicoccus sciuri]UIU26087.1 hypothetical protein LLZ92_04625 [Mammaliicoccus sciuri]